MPHIAAMMNAVIPKAKIINVFNCKNVVPRAVAPTDKPKQIVQMYNNALEAVCTKFGTTPLSLIKLPNIKQPINGVHEGTMIQQTKVTIIGKRILSFLVASLGDSILICLSSFVVNKLIIGGKMIGTRAM